MSEPIVKTGSITFPPVGRCIYCGIKNNDLRREHIIPFGLGGTFILPQASCRACEKITGKVEQACLRMMYGDTRIKFGLPTRRPKERPKIRPVVLGTRDESGKIIHREVINVPAEEVPTSIVGLDLWPAGFLSGQQPHENLNGSLWVISHKPSADQYHRGPHSTVRVGTINPWLLARMIAKIAHSFAVAEGGLDSFNPFLVDLILGKTHVICHYIGGDFKRRPAPDTRGLHKLQAYPIDHKNKKYLRVDVQLFCGYTAPEYQIIVGELI